MFKYVAVLVTAGQSAGTFPAALPARSNARSLPA